MRKGFIYGADGRSNVGYGFWQLAYASKAPLTAENYEPARAAMSSLRGDNGHPLGIVPNKLVVPIALEGAGRRILNTQLKSQSTTLANPGGGDETAIAEVRDQLERADLDLAVREAYLSAEYRARDYSRACSLRTAEAEVPIATPSYEERRAAYFNEGAEQ